MKNKISSILDAKRMLENEYPDLRVKNGVDYDKYYVFSTEPKQHDAVRDGRWLNGLLAVDKTTQNIIGFNPFGFDADEYFKAVEERSVKFDNTSLMSDRDSFIDAGKTYINQLFTSKR